MSTTNIDSIKQQVLIIESAAGNETASLMRRLRELDIPMLVVRDFAQAEFALKESNSDFAAVLIPTQIGASAIAEAIPRLQTLAPPEGLGFVSVGDTPSKADRKTLRCADVTLAVWNPSSQAMLRFQLNRAFHRDRNTFGIRDAARVPTDLTATVTVGERSKEAQLFNLGETGAFLATKRAIMDGAILDVEIHLHDGPLRIDAEVVYANVPGNLQRPGLPLGMGVRFLDLPRTDAKRLRSIINEIIDRLDV